MDTQDTLTPSKKTCQNHHQFNLCDSCYMSFVRFKLL